MNSPYIIIAYLHNPNHTFKIEDDWEWNSKRWRELFIVQKGIINEINYMEEIGQGTNKMLVLLLFSIS
jgi:hypothetical protein